MKKRVWRLMKKSPAEVLIDYKKYRDETKNRPDWKEFEEIAKHAEIFEEYEIEGPKKSRSTGKTPDIYGKLKKDRKQKIVADAKYRKILSTASVNQVKKYKSHPFYAKDGAIIVAEHTQVPERVRKKAEASNIKIHRVGLKEKIDRFLEYSDSKKRKKSQTKRDHRKTD